MAEGADDDPNTFLRHHQHDLTNVVVAAGLWSVADACEERDVIGSDVKEKIVSDSTGKTEPDRASLLLKTIRSSLMGRDVEIDEETVEKFLCILYEKSAMSGRHTVKTVARSCKLSYKNNK